MERILEAIKYCFLCLLDIMFPGPSSCPLCGGLLKRLDESQICPQCLEKLGCPDGKHYKADRFLGKTGCGEGCFDKIYGIYLYKGAARSMVTALKYKGRTSLAKAMAVFMCKQLDCNKEAFDIIVPVPTHEKRRKERGYNQAELIALQLSRQCGKPLVKALIKHKDTPTQVKLEEKDRWKNVKGAFNCIGRVSGKRVLLVDDVITTGATMYYCSTQLKLAGALEVISIAFTITE